MKKILLTLLLCISGLSNAAITDQRFSTAQVFGITYGVGSTFLTYTGTLNYAFATVNSSGVSTAFTRLTAAEYANFSSNDRYIAFYNSPTVANTYGVAVFNSDGSIYRVINYTGTFRALADGAILYRPNGTGGTLFTTKQGYAIGTGPMTFTLTEQNPSNTSLANYIPATTQPLAVGQSVPTYASNITTQQQARVNSATNLRDTTVRNSIYIEQVGSDNQVTIIQDSKHNMVTGTGSTAAPIQGDYNTITIRQGDPASNHGKNLIQMSVYGSYNTLNLNQGRDSTGNYTGADVGGHMQYIIVSGSNNSVTTQQQNSGVNTNHYLEANITGHNNTQNMTQLGNTSKQVFTTTNGDNNTFNSFQDGVGAHYLNVNFLGNGNDAQVTQTGTTRNAATINLINNGAPASVTLQQSGGQTYNIDRTCTTACGRVTVTQP